MRELPLFGSLPLRGVWTDVGLGRGQFFAILGTSVLLFVGIGGVVWRHVHEGHFWRIGISYGVIPPAVVAALAWNRTWSVWRAVAASAILALAKLVLTALLLLIVALGGGR